MWFTPKYTTDEMRVKLKDPEFDYELSCDQMCGKGHFSMKGIVKVVTQDEFILWRAKQQSNYARVMAEKTPAVPAQTDSAKATTTKSNTEAAAKLVAEK